MKFKEFENQLTEINNALFAGFKNDDGKEGPNLGSFMRAKISEPQKSILILNINPNPKGSSDESGQDDWAENAPRLIYVPKEYNKEMLERFKNKIIWNGFFDKPYNLVADKVKMFWTTDDNFKEEIGNACPECKSAWNACFEAEKKKEKEYILGFPELFYQCDGDQSKVEKYLGKTKSNTIEQVKKIMNLYIDFYNPKLIIVTNAYASKLIYQSQGNDLPLKTDEIDIKHNGKDVKVLFSSMLFGRGTLDNASYDKLQQRIERFIEKDLKSK